MNSSNAKKKNTSRFDYISIELAKEVATFNDFSSRKSLYQFLDGVCSKFISNSKVLILSTPRKEYDRKSIRVHWNRKEANAWLDSLGKKSSQLAEVFEAASILTGKEKYHSVSFGEGELSKIGSDPDQEYWFFIPNLKNAEIYESLQYILYFARHCFLTIKKWEEVSKLSTLIYIDDVTGLFNQRKLMMDLDESIRKYQVYKESFSVLFLDLDHFKSVNDGHGHMVGTRILLNIAELLKEVVRDSDLLYRYGGDEFVIILHNADVNIAKVVGQRILDAFKRRKFDLDENNKKILSSSIGVATYPDHANSREDILKIADKMMYEAKNHGRGQVRLAKDFFSSTSKKSSD